MGAIKACNRVDSTTSVPVFLYPLHSVCPQSLSPLGKCGGDAGASLCVCDTRLGLLGLLYSWQETLEAQHVHFTDEETKAGGGKGHAAGSGGAAAQNSLGLWWPQRHFSESGCQGARAKWRVNIWGGNPVSSNSPSPRFRGGRVARAVPGGQGRPLRCGWDTPAGPAPARLRPRL